MTGTETWAICLHKSMRNYGYIKKKGDGEGKRKTTLKERRPLPALRRGRRSE